MAYYKRQTHNNPHSTTHSYVKGAGLCMLHEFARPLRIAVMETPGILHEGRLKVKLSQDDWRALKREPKYDRLFLDTTELLVPEQCVVFPVTFTNTGKTERCNNALANLLQLNIDEGELVAWTPPISGQYKKVIPGSVLFAGTAIGNPADTFAYISPLKSLKEGFLGQNKLPARFKVDGWGYIYKAQLEDIYRWSDIGKARQLVLSQLRFEQIICQTCELGNDKLLCYELVYTNSQVDQRSNSCANVTKSNEGFQLQKVPGIANTQVNTTHADPTKNMKKLNIADDNKFGLVKTASQNYESLWNTDSGHSEVKNNDVGSNAGKRAYNSDISVHTSGQLTNSSRLAKKPSIEATKFQLFGRCYMQYCSSRFEKIVNVQQGDIVSGKSRINADTVGQVDVICELTVEYKKAVYIGVKFEAEVNVDPYITKHNYGSWCNGICREDRKYVLIPLELLQSTDTSLDKPFHFVKEVNTIEPKLRSYALPSPLSIRKVNPDILRRIGVEGKRNSCYLDATIFAFFSFSKSFDKSLQKLEAAEIDSMENEKTEQVRSLLRDSVIVPLREMSIVRWNRVFEIRKILAEVLNDDNFIGGFMDAGIVISSVFSKILKVPEFFEIDPNSKDYVMQIFRPHGKKFDRPSVQQLVEEYFKFDKMKLSKIPNPAFLIKLPISNGDPQFRSAYPNLQLQMDEILKNPGTKGNLMNLRAVICLHIYHFTCFVRVLPDDVNTKPKWIYHDSMAGESHAPLTVECEGLEEALEQVNLRYSNPASKVNDYGLSSRTKYSLNHLMDHIYLCVYEPVKEAE